MRARTLINATVLCTLLLVTQTVDVIAGKPDQPSSKAERHEVFPARTPETRKLGQQADQLWHDRKIADCAKVTERIVQLDPGNLEAWKILAWMHAYVLATNSKTSEERDREIAKGVDFLHKALKANPGSSEPNSELGWMNIDRTGDVKVAVQYYKAALKTATD